MIFGDSAANILEGGLGNDSLNGGAGSDTLSFAGSAQSIQVDLGALGSPGRGYSWDGLAQDNFTGMENVVGSNFNDVIFGDSAANILEGGLGNDFLSGGGSGDRFVFRIALFGNDTIAQWDDGSDVLDFVGSGLNITSFTIAQFAANTILTLNVDPMQTITFLNTLSINITADDFL